MEQTIKVVHVLRNGEPKCPKCGQELETGRRERCPPRLMGRRPALVGVRGLQDRMGPRMKQL
jgi:tRNA(Ile2) C34 agmatinyltransferase TiaS